MYLTTLGETEWYRERMDATESYHLLAVRYYTIQLISSSDFYSHKIGILAANLSACSKN